MDEPCFCTWDDILTCFVDKTKVSLPVLITACALGYIWLARKKERDIKKQCTVIEDDMKHIKRENFQIAEEIRHLKCVVSDTQLMTTSLDRCHTDRSRPKTNQCCIPERYIDKSLAEGDRCVSRKKRDRKTKNKSSCCGDEYSHFTSYSTPDVYPKEFDETLALKSNQEYPEFQTSRFEFRPRAESTHIKKELGCEEKCPSPEAQSFYDPSCCFETKKKRNRFSNGNSERISRKKQCFKPSCYSPELFKESIDCFRYFDGVKTSNSSDKPILKTNRYKDLKDKRGQSPKNISDRSQSSSKSCFPIANCSKVRKKSPRQQCFELKPPDRCDSRSYQLKQKIERYKKELETDINSCLNSLNNQLRQKNNSNDKLSCNFTSRDHRCRSRS